MIDKKYNYKTTPVARKSSQITGDKYRFTILTPMLIRIEYDKDGVFEDRATKTVVNRCFDEVDFSQDIKNNILTITTSEILLKYDTTQDFNRNSLCLCYTCKKSPINAGKKSAYWYYGEEAPYCHDGTARTLDEADGACELEKSIMSQDGQVSVLDDSKSFVITKDGWIEPRKEDTIDMYLFCYGEVAGENNSRTFTTTDNLACLKAFYSLTGKQPLIPRYAFGNWWSRYHEYTQEEYEALINRFEKEEIPFSVAVIDMDWHYTKIDPKYGKGWTGYTWNKELFPDHVAFMEFLHNKGYKVTLNLHPQQGVGAHEKAYRDMALSMGIDPETEETVEFDITNPKFLENYFSILHHPMEKEGVDFWWMDWQQGNTTMIKGIDPLWMLNHFHYIDNGRDGKRPMLFSRYSGPGSHRYPLGFSGDTIISWQSLDFQPYFTSSASNIGYGWWSHDIGGHMLGQRSEELTGRWIQLGCFSPINRLHSNKHPFLGKEPWKYNKITELSMRKFLKLRHELIPYLYSMNYRSHFMDEPLVQPMYYRFDCRELRLVKNPRIRNEFTFGTEMIVSPITKPHDTETMLGSSIVYLPEGTWYDYFTNMRYKGARTFDAYRDMYEMPVFVKAGGIIPHAVLTHVNDTGNPESLKIKVYAGNSNTFELYEDDGITNDYLSGKYAITKMEFLWGTLPEFTIYEPCGDTDVIPKVRNYEIEFIGFDTDGDITVTVNNKPCAYRADKEKNVFCVSAENVNGSLKIKFNNEVKEAKNDITEPLAKLMEHSEIKTAGKDRLFYAMIDPNLSTAQKLAKLHEFKLPENMNNAVFEIITSDTL